MDDAEALIATVGARLKQLRHAAGYTQEAMAQRVGCGLRNYQRLETGLVNMSLRTVARLAEALEVPAVDLLAAPPRRQSVANEGRPAARKGQKRSRK